MAAVVIPRDREYAYALLPVPRDCRSVLPGCRNRPTYRTTFYVRIADGDHKYGGAHTVNTALGCAGRERE